MSKSLKFKATIEINGVNPYVLISENRAKTLKDHWKKPMPVRVQVNSQPNDPWKINMMPKGDGSFYLYLHNDVRKASRTKVGDKVTVRVSYDHTYINGPIHDIPNDLKQAIDEDVDVNLHWDALPPSRQKEILRYLDRIKSPDIRKDNIIILIPLLKGQDGHYMGRDWHNGK